MPNRQIHCAISKSRTGKAYSELHKWLDYDERNLGVNHRSKNHFYTTELKNYVYENFGGAEAVSEWLFHIALDNLDTYVTNEWNYNGNSFNLIKFGFKENGFIHCQEDDFDDDEIDEEFD